MGDTSVQLLEVLPEPYLLLTTEGVVVKANPAACRLLSQDKDQLAGRELFAITADDPERTRAYLKLCSRNLSFCIGVVTFATERGPEKLRCEGVALRSEDGGSGMVLLRLKPQEAAIDHFRVLNAKVQALTQEVQRRAAAEEALRRSEALFREMADAMPQIAWAAGPNGKTDYFNRRWYELVGRKDAGEDSWLGILHPDDRQRCLDTWHEAVNSGRNYEIEYRFKFPHEDRYRWFLGRALPVRDEAGRIVRWFGTCTDVDDQKRAEERLEKAVEERTLSLRAALAQMEEFSYSVSHDLRAPIRAMHGFAQVLKADYGDRLDELGLGYLDRILRAGERMDKLILDVLSYSHVTRSEMPVRPVILNQVIEDVIQQFPALQPPLATLEIERLEDVLGHEPTLMQALSNLLCNAVKFITPGVQPKVAVWTERKGERVRLWVKDNGIGILPEYQTRVFGLFERIHSDSKYEGTGIGLAIVRRSMERMGGDCGVESDGKNGSRFWVELPAANS